MDRITKTESTVSRRSLLGAVGLALGVAAVPRARAEESRAFTFPLLGDLHFDRLSHHDMMWLEREMPKDISQVRDYSRLTESVLPRLFPEVRGQVADAKAKVPFLIQIGDLVEGLSGTPELARLQCREALTFVREAKLGAPFHIIKGNHDVTGPGSVEAFNQVLLPFAGEQAGQELKTACYTVEKDDALFVYYDAYSKDSLPWLEKTLEGRSARHVFFLIHPPVIPTGARSTWHIFAKPNQAAERQRLLRVLGRHRAIVLCGHLHKYSTLVRKTEEGPLLQMMVSSVISNPDAAPKQVLEGVQTYNPELVKVEPAFSPDTEAERREMIALEAPSIRHYEYADAPGYALVTVDGPKVTAQLYQGLGRRNWKTLDLSGLLNS